GPASAADLSPPPPPPEMVPEPVGSGWYLRGDFTESSYHRPADATRPDVKDPGMPQLVGLRLSDAEGYGGGVGYRVTPWLRVDATIDQRGSSRLRGFSSRSNFATGGNVETGRVNVLTGLVNVYADLGTWWGLTPYVGGGIGFSETGMTHAVTQTACYVDACDGVAGTGPRDAVKRPNRTLASFAYALTAGASYALGHGLSLDAAYRYVDLGGIKSGADSFGAATRLKELAASEFRLGLRYDLSALSGFAGAASNPYGN
ncbi:outer membrane protein, partial [Methylobacterium trifolii]